MRLSKDKMQIHKCSIFCVCGICVFVYGHVHTCGGQKRMSGVLFYQFPPYFLDRVSP